MFSEIYNYNQQYKQNMVADLKKTKNLVCNIFIYKNRVNDYCIADLWALSTGPSGCTSTLAMSVA